MKKLTPCIAIGLMLLSFTFSGCSKSKEAEQAKESKSSKTVTQQTEEAIREYGKRPMDAAREAQQMGGEHTRAVDEAVKAQ